MLQKITFTEWNRVFFVLIKDTDLFWRKEALKILIPFLIAYLRKAGFSSAVVTKAKAGNKLELMDD